MTGKSPQAVFGDVMVGTSFLSGEIACIFFNTDCVFLILESYRLHVSKF